MQFYYYLLLYPTCTPIHFFRLLGFQTYYSCRTYNAY